MIASKRKIRTSSITFRYTWFDNGGVQSQQSCCPLVPLSPSLVRGHPRLRQGLPRLGKDAWLTLMRHLRECKAEPSLHRQTKVVGSRLLCMSLRLQIQNGDGRGCPSRNAFGFRRTTTSVSSIHDLWSDGASNPMGSLVCSSSFASLCTVVARSFLLQTRFHRDPDGVQNSIVHPGRVDPGRRGSSPSGHFYHSIGTIRHGSQFHNIFATPSLGRAWRFFPPARL